MTDISINDVTRRVQFTGNTTTGPFAFTFNILTAADIQVFKNNTLQSLTTHYTVSINANGTGSVTMGSALVASDVLTIIGGRAIARTTDFVTAGDLLASSLNEQLDSIVIMAQQLSERVDRAVTAVPGEVVADLSLPDKDARKGTVLGFNSTTGNPEAGPTIADVQSLANITADIQTLAHIEDGTDATDAIQSVASNSSNINTVAGISSNVSTVAGISSNVTSVAGGLTNVNTVAGSIGNVNTVGSSISNVNTVAGISSNVTTVAGSDSNITLVAGSISDINALAPSSVRNDMAGLNQTAVKADMAALAETDVLADMAALAETSVLANMAQLGTASVVADIGTLADAQDGTTGTNAITTVATNLTNVNNFANRYRIGSSDPTDSLDAGDLFFNTTSNKLRVYSGSNWIDAGSEHATLNIFEYTATAGQTAFTGNDINGNSLNYSTTAFQVALNGVLLPPEDYTATSATVFTLDSDAAASAGDSLTIYSYSSFALSASPIFSTNANTTVATTTTGFQITNTTNTPTDNATLKLKKVDSSPNDAENIGNIQFESTNGSGTDLVYGEIQGRIDDVASSTSNCEGEILLNVLKNGSLTGSQYKFEGVLNRLNFMSEQRLYWSDHKGTNFHCELDWETPTATRNVKLPNATGTLSYLHIASDAFTNVASKSFSSLSNAYNAYFITFSLLPATDGAHLDLYLGEGSSYLDSLSNHYGYAYTDKSSFNSDNSHGSIQIGGNMGSADHEGISGSFIFHNRGFTTSQIGQPPMVHGQYLLRSTGNIPDGGNFYGAISSTETDQAFNSVKFQMSSGNIANGSVHIYGLLKSF